MARVVGAGQEPGAETNVYIFSMISQPWVQVPDSVSLDYYNKLPQTGRLGSNRNLVLTVPEAGSLSPSVW